MKKQARFAMILLASVFGAVAKAADFVPYVEDSSNVWSRLQQSWLQGETASWFRPISAAAGAELRYPGYSNSPTVDFLGHKVHEMVLRFGTNGLAQIMISTYNRGDAGDLSGPQFSALVSAMDKSITKWAGADGRMRAAEKLSANATINSKVWLRKNLAAEMEWSASKHAASARDANGFRAEYIKLVLTPYDARAVRPSAGLARSGPSPTAMGNKRNVRKDGEFVFIDNMPMVDQGEKGYCAVATAERILRYYGKNLDQHMLAQMADTQTGGGTSPDVMFDVFRRIGLKLGVKIDVHYDCSVRQLLNTVSKYNQQAKKDEIAPVDLGQGGVIDILAVYQAMDRATLHRARCEREQTAYKKFLADIVRCVDLGIPVAWSVILGIVKEETALPQAGGGHMRIIYGYNKKTEELVYTDSWGLGHERKTMSFDNAWTITTGLSSLDPRH